jgi:hypothetical protein
VVTRSGGIYAFSAPCWWKPYVAGHLDQCTVFNTTGRTSPSLCGDGHCYIQIKLPGSHCPVWVIDSKCGAGQEAHKPWGGWDATCGGGKVDHGDSWHPSGGNGGDGGDGGAGGDGGNSYGGPSRLPARLPLAVTIHCPWGAASRQLGGPSPSQPHPHHAQQAVSRLQALAMQAMAATAALVAMAATPLAVAMPVCVWGGQ